MAKRKQLTGPYSRVTAPNVYPVVPIKNVLATAANSTPVYEEVELNLQFEVNEVFDIMKIESWILPAAYDGAIASGTADCHMALLDSTLSTENVDTDATFEAMDDLIFYAEETYIHTQGAAAALIMHPWMAASRHLEFYTEPFTVARNVLWTIVLNQSTAFFTGNIITGRVIIWGRRRRASDSEFKDIIYRERF